MSLPPPPVRRSTLADANERRDWRIHAALAQRLITQARTLYVDEELGLDLTNTVYALDSATIALCLSVFPWATLPHHQGGGEDAHAARPAGQHSEFYPHLGWQAARRSVPSICSCRKPEHHLRRGSWLRRLCPPLCVAPSRGLLDVTRAKSNIDAHRVYSAPTDRSTGIICDQTISLERLLHPSGLPRTSAAHPLQGPRVRQDAGLHHQQLLASGRHHLRALQKPLAGGTLLQVDQLFSIFGSSSSTARRRTR